MTGGSGFAVVGLADMISGRKMIVVGISEIRLSREALSHILNFIVVDKRYTGLAQRTCFAIFIFGLLDSTRETVRANIWKLKRAKGLIIAEILLDITMIVRVAVMLLLMSSFGKGNCEETCQTKLCLETADRVLNSMNETANPCEDFHEFACRGWIRNNPIPRLEDSRTPKSIIEDEIELRLYKILDTPDKKEDGRPIRLARALYRNCMDRRSVENLGIKPLNDAFTKLGLPQTPPTDEEAAHIDIPKIAGSALRHYEINIFVDVHFSQDPKNSFKRQLTIEQTSADTDKLDVYLRDPVRFNSKVKLQHRYIEGMMGAAGAKEKHESYATEIMNFMTEIVKIQTTPEGQARNYTYYDVTIRELQNLTDPDVKYWNWTTYLNALFEQTDVILDPENDIVRMEDISYFKNVPLLLSKTSRGIAVRYLWWKVYAEIAPQTKQAYRDFGDHFGRQAYYFESDKPTWYGCTTIAKHFFSEALTAAYLEKYFNVQNKKSATEMWTDLSSSFDEMLTEYTWLDDTTKAQARRKLRALTPLIAYPDWIIDPAKLEEYYKEYEVTEGHVVHMYENFKSIERKRYLNSWRQPIDKNEWIVSSLEVNARYFLSRNTVVFTTGVMHKPYYGNAAEALNYGAAGALAAHELTHGFDTYGQLVDENTTLRQWWSEESRKHYKEKVDCVIKQYSGYEVTQLGKNFTLNGVLTREENVADMGGLAIAFKAYKKLKARSQPQQPLPGVAKYTDEQLFFLGYAQMFCDRDTDDALEDFIKKDKHSPGRFRIIGALQNNADFAKVWNCPAGSPMNPEKKCTVW